MPSHSDDGGGSGAFEARGCLAACADEAFDFAGASGVVAVFVVLWVVMVVVRVGLGVWVHFGLVLGRGTDADEEKAAFEAADYDGASTELNGDVDWFDGVSRFPARSDSISSGSSSIVGGAADASTTSPSSSSDTALVIAIVVIFMMNAIVIIIMTIIGGRRAAGEVAGGFCAGQSRRQGKRRGGMDGE